MIDIRDHGGPFGGGKKKAKAVFRSIQKLRPISDWSGNVARPYYSDRPTVFPMNSYQIATRTPFTNNNTTKPAVFNLSTGTITLYEENTNPIKHNLPSNLVFRATNHYIVIEFNGNWEMANNTTIKIYNYNDVLLSSKTFKTYTGNPYLKVTNRGVFFQEMFSRSGSDQVFDLWFYQFSTNSFHSLGRMTTSGATSTVEARVCMPSDDYFITYSTRINNQYYNIYRLNADCTITLIKTVMTTNSIYYPEGRPYNDDSYHNAAGYKLIHAINGTKTYAVTQYYKDGGQSLWLKCGILDYEKLIVGTTWLNNAIDYVLIDSVLTGVSTEPQQFYNVGIYRTKEGEVNLIHWGHIASSGGTGLNFDRTTLQSHYPFDTNNRYYQRIPNYIPAGWPSSWSMPGHMAVDIENKLICYLGINMDGNNATSQIRYARIYAFEFERVEFHNE